MNDSRPGQSGRYGMRVYPVATTTELPDQLPVEVCTRQPSAASRSTRIASTPNSARIPNRRA